MNKKSESIMGVAFGLDYRNLNYVLSCWDIPYIVLYSVCNKSIEETRVIKMLYQLKQERS